MCDDCMTHCKISFHRTHEDDQHQYVIGINETNCKTQMFAQNTFKTNSITQFIYEWQDNTYRYLRQIKQ